METVNQLFRHFPKQSKIVLLWASAAACMKTVLFVLLHDFVIALAAFEKNGLLLLIGLGVLMANLALEIVYYRKAGELFQQLLSKLKMEVNVKLKNTSLLKFEQIGQSKLFSSISQNTSILSNILHFMPASLLHGAVSLIFMLGYIITQLPMAGYVFMAWMIGIGGVVFLRIGPTLFRVRKVIHTGGHHYLEGVESLLNGFKEIRVNQAKQKGVLNAHFIRAKHAVDWVKKNIFIDRFRVVLGESYFLALLVFLVFVVGSLATEEYRVLITSTVILMLMLMRSVLYILVSFEDWRVVDTAIAELLALFGQLKEEKDPVRSPSQTQVKLMHQLELRNVHFEYPNNESGYKYGIGPINLTVKKGECIFVVGGNGAGKSTLLKLITQLYKPQKGTVLRDFKPVHHWKTSAYQDLFSCIFTDFHLFSQLYGLDGVHEDHVQHLLEVFGIDHRVTLEQNTFQFQGLSTGQRKRLAMLQVFLENRSIYIFDEVAADQDPTYRQFFYEVILKDLKKLNKTVIAVSHDEHYFHVADRVLEMTNGKLTPYQPQFLSL